jgi:4-cresol dehydrogenase (hydroxylating)
MKNLKKAVRAWTTVLSVKRVIVDTQILKRASTATFKTSQKIHVILKPINSDEVSSILKIANKNSIPVYPVSGGKNWGLGSKVPPKDGVLVDLSLMKKISRYDEEMAYITVEPGVTFREAESFLIRKKSSLMLDSIGSTPDASIIGNTAERGHGMALYADRFNFVCGLEVVLPTGEIIDTGFENFGGSKLGPLAKWGLGPYVDGLFTQSNLGIITRLTLWLRPKPKFFQSFIFNVSDEKNLSFIMDSWRQMGLEGLQSSLRIFNDMRMISFGERFPENEQVPLPEELVSVMRKKLRIGKWIGLGALYSISQHHAEADREFIINHIKKFTDNITFYDQATVDNQYARADEATKNQLDFMFNKSLLRGYTSASGINMTYWRKPDSVKVSNLHDDGCGVLWYCPAIPFTGKDARNAIKICERISHKYGFELNIGFLFISQRALDITGAICYDRHKPGEDERAMLCHHELLETMLKNGYSPYRLGIQSMGLMKHKQHSSVKFVKKLKSSLDEKSILAPGRYLD